MPALNSERHVDDAILSEPEALGYPGALAIRNVRVAPESGRVDLMLLPRRGRHRLVLVEVKRAAAGDAASKVIGQLLMYYAGALTLGSEGLGLLRRYAKNERTQALSRNWTSAQMVTGVRPRDAAWKVMQGGAKLTPEQLSLFIALDGDAHKALAPTISVLRDHGLPTGLLKVRTRRVERVAA